MCPDSDPAAPVTDRFAGCDPDATRSGSPALVVVSQEALDAITAHARSEAPRECCGLLIGTAGRILRAHRAQNTLASPSRFEIDPVDHFAARHAARADGLAVVGAYHSHPHSPPTPSPRDRDEACDPDLVHLIIGFDSAGAPDIRGFVIAPGLVTPLALAVVALEARVPSEAGDDS